MLFEIQTKSKLNRTGISSWIIFPLSFLLFITIFAKLHYLIVEIWVCNWVILIKFIYMEGNVFFNLMTQKNDILCYCEIENYKPWKFGIRYRLT